MNSRLQAKVIAQNRVNAAANRFKDLAIPLFKNLIGKKVVTGHRLSVIAQKWINTIPPAGPEVKGVQSWLWKGGPNSLIFCFKASEPCGDHGCVYADAHVFIGSVEEGKLVSVSEDTSRLRESYSPEEVEEIRANVSRTRASLNDWIQKLGSFGEYDN